MNLNIRRVSGQLYCGRAYSVDPPEKQVDNTTVHDFHLVIVSMAEALHSWTKEDVLRQGSGGRWNIWTKSRRHVLTSLRKGHRLYVFFSAFPKGEQTFLESVQDRINLDQELQRYNDEMERRNTQRIDIPVNVIDEWIKDRGYASGKHLHVGTDPRMTPPPLPQKPIHTPKEDI